MVVIQSHRTNDTMYNKCRLEYMKEMAKWRFAHHSEKGRAARISRNDEVDIKSMG